VPIKHSCSACSSFDKEIPQIASSSPPIHQVFQPPTLLLPEESIWSKISHDYQRFAALAS
jgi:hypothetical protein